MTAEEKQKLAQEEPATEGNEQPKKNPDEGTKTEGNEPKGEGKPTEEEKDKFGQPGINREKYQREIKERDDQIAALQSKVDELAKTEEGRAEAQKRIDELKQTIADDRLNFELEKAGCLNTKAGKALLGDFDNDIAKLKEACPYLFSGEKKTGSTGAKPVGAPDKVDETLDRIFGK